MTGLDAAFREARAEKAWSRVAKISEEMADLARNIEEIEGGIEASLGGIREILGLDGADYETLAAGKQPLDGEIETPINDQAAEDPEILPDAAEDATTTALDQDAPGPDSIEQDPAGYPDELAAEPQLIGSRPDTINHDTEALPAPPHDGAQFPYPGFAATGAVTEPKASAADPEDHAPEDDFSPVVRDIEDT